MKTNATAVIGIEREATDDPFNSKCGMIFERSREVDEEVFHVHNCPRCEWNWRHFNEECEAKDMVGRGTDWPCPACEERGDA